MKFRSKETSVVVLLWFKWCILEDIPSDVFKDGQPVAHEHFPFVVSLQEWGERWEHVCVGNIVDQRNVLTASQCVGEVRNGSVEFKDPKGLRVYAGAGDMDCGCVEERYVMVMNVTVHPRVSHNVNMVAFDLAMLHLAQDLEFNHEILPMSLPVTDTTRHSKAFCYSPGWGRRWGNHSKNLTLVEYQRISHSQCYHILCNLFALCSEDLAEQEQTCAVNKRATSRFTDLGSPLVCHGSVYGMATFNAGLNSPIIFTGLNPILEMINKTKEHPRTHKHEKNVENDTATALRALKDRNRLEEWVRMLSSSQVHQATRIILALECLLALTA